MNVYTGKKNKIMINSTNDISVDISMNSQKLEEVISFKYFGATLSKNGTCLAKIGIKTASATEAIARLNRIWQSNTTFTSKFKLYKLYKSLIISILSGCNTWILLANSETKIQDFATKYPRNLSIPPT